MKLLFIYNANSGSVNALVDTAHKIISPSTYDCNLCDLTYGAFKEESEWKKFRKSVSIPFVFLHKDQFLKSYRSKWLPKYDFPIVLVEKDAQLEIGITSENLKRITNLEELVEEVNKVMLVFKSND